jgi:hypothetical protein
MNKNQIKGYDMKRDKNQVGFCDLNYVIQNEGGSL